MPHIRAEVQPAAKNDIFSAVGIAVQRPRLARGEHWRRRWRLDRADSTSQLEMRGTIARDHEWHVRLLDRKAHALFRAMEAHDQAAEAQAQPIVVRHFFGRETYAPRQYRHRAECWRRLRARRRTRRAWRYSSPSTNCTSGRMPKRRVGVSSRRLSRRRTA